MAILLVGMNHRTADIRLREKVAFSAESAVRGGKELIASGVLREVVILSTCNRSEVYAVPAAQGHDPGSSLRRFYGGVHGIEANALDGSLYRHSDTEAVRHLFRVAAGLDSMLLGEAEILGQVRAAYLQAHASGLTGTTLNRVFQAALEVGKRVRSQTELGARPMSVALAAVKLAEHLFRDFRGRTALIVGAGTAGEQLVEHLHNRGMQRLIVANRSLDHARELAGRFGAQAMGLAALKEAVTQADILITSAGDSDCLVNRTLVGQAMEARGNRSMFVVDLAVPRNVSPEVAGLYNVYLYNLDDLSGIVEQNRKAREREIPAAERLVDKHVSKFEDWQAGVEISALVRHVRESVSQLREELLRQRIERLPDLSEPERVELMRLAEQLVRLAREGSSGRIRNAAELRRRVRELDRLREVLGLARERS